MMSLFSNLLSDSKSIACLLKNLILSSIIINELLSTPLILGDKNVHSKRSLLYSPIAWGIALIHFKLNDPSTYSLLNLQPYLKQHKFVHNESFVILTLKAWVVNLTPPPDPSSVFPKTYLLKRG